MLFPLCLMAASYDHLASGFAASGTITERQLTPRTARRLACTMAATVTTTVRVVGGVHDNATNGWANAHATFATGRADLDVLVLLVANHTEGSHTFDTEAANFA